MSYTDPGTYGAKQQSWRKANPRETLKHIIDSDPKGTEEQWWQEWLDAIKADVDQFETVCKYWWANNLRSLMNDRHSTPQARRNTVKAKAQETAAQIILMNALTPSGKLLGDSTGAECKKFGGFYAAIAKIVPANKKVSEVLDERKLRSLWNGKS